MEYNENNRPKCLADCRIDWIHYPVSGENGKVTLEDCSHLRNEWLEEDCACDANNLADTVKCDKYFAFDYDYETLRLFYKIPDYEGTPFEIWGLQKMFNDNWLLTPAFVKWMGKDSFGFIVYECWLESFLNGIHDPRMRVEILKFIVKHVNYIIPDTKKKELPRLKNTLDRYEAAYKLEKKMNMEKKQKRVIERNTYNNCTFNNCNNTENSYYGTPLNAQPSSVSPETIVPPVGKESHSGKQLFCRITKAAYEKGVAQKVDNDLRSASISAPKLCKVIKLNEALDYLDTKDMHSTDLYVLLDEHYHLPFKIRTFQDCRSK